MIPLHSIAPSGGSASSSCIQVWFFFGEKGRTCVLWSFTPQVALSCSHSSCPEAWMSTEASFAQKMCNDAFSSEFCALFRTCPALHTPFLPSFIASQSYHCRRSILFASCHPFHLARRSHLHPQALHTKKTISSSIYIPLRVIDS